MVSLCTNCPCASRHTTLQPVLKPGSMARIRFSPKGDPKRSCLRFLAKTVTAVSSAFFLASDKASLDNAGSKRRL